MMSKICLGAVVVVTVLTFLPTRAVAGPVTLFSTGNPDGKIATLSRPAGPGALETETADDFVLGQNALISGATFVGLLPSGALLSSINQVEIEFYHVFPVDSVNPPSGKVLTRVNSPSDNEFAAFDSTLGTLSFSASILNASFSAANSVVNGIHQKPNQFTGGEGPVTGEEVEFDITFSTPFFVGATDHDFFRPEVGVGSGGQFLWLSAPKPIVSPGTALQFPSGTTDLQSWIRNTALAPDWERIGTDVTGQGPFNATFSLSGESVASNPVPEPASLLLLASGLGGAAWSKRRSKTR
jgi:hypothetical protein